MFCVDFVVGMGEGGYPKRYPRGYARGTPRGTNKGWSGKIWYQVKKRISSSRAKTEEPATKTMKHTREANDDKVWRDEMVVIRDCSTIPLYIP